MGVATVYMCDECGKSQASTWSGEPKGWVRLEAKAYWDETNYHIFPGGIDGKRWSFCSLKCFIAFMDSGNKRQY